MGPASAEYRAFELLITNQVTGQSRIVISTLDHIQFPQYYPLNAGEIAEYQTSWMCWDNTSHQQTCPKPE
jgi:hypothetical protein